MHKKTFEKLGQHSEVMWVCKNCKALEKKPAKLVKVVKWGNYASLCEISNAADFA